jgi:hypothetical protein
MRSIQEILDEITLRIAAADQARIRSIEPLEQIVCAIEADTLYSLKEFIEDDE